MCALTPTTEFIYTHLEFKNRKKTNNWTTLQDNIAVYKRELQQQQKLK